LGTLWKKVKLGGNSFIDQKGTQLAQRLGNNLQNRYLKGVNYLINQNLDRKIKGKPLLNQFFVFDVSEGLKGVSPLLMES
jgi:hypothetical protein